MGRGASRGSAGASKGKTIERKWEPGKAVRLEGIPGYREVQEKGLGAFLKPLPAGR